MRRLAPTALAVLLCGCGGTGEHSRPDRGIARAERRPPRAGASPTTSAGGAEDPLQARYAEREALEVLRGRASYYADSLAGNRTASGDRYDPRAFTAANRDLPFGTVLRVVREDTGASVIVRVNDRGPFRDRRRILDLSRAAAAALDMVGAGVVEVRAEIVERPRD